MLNEKQEYRLYLTPGYGGLIRADNISDGLSGIRAVLTVLTRGFFDQCRACGADDLDRLHRYGTAFLRVWMAGRDALPADTDEEMRHYPALYADLQKAADSNLLDHINRENIPLIFSDGKFTTPAARRQKIWNKISFWEKSLFFSMTKDSQNQLYFSVAIADALHEGPLTNRVLMLRRENSMYGMDGEIGQSNWLECALATVSVYLQKKPAGQISAAITRAQLSNYLNKSTDTNGAKKKKISISRLVNKCPLSYKGQPLFTKSTVTGASNKLIVNPAWMRDMDAHLAASDAPVPTGYERLTDADLFPDRFGDKQSEREYIR